MIPDGARFTRFEWHFPAFREARNSPAVQAWVLDAAQGAARRAGDGFTADVRPGRTRAQARVRAGTEEADIRNRRDNTILKAGNGGAS